MQKKMLTKREIPLSEVMECMKSPEQVISGDQGRFIYQKRLPLNGKRKILRVIVERENENIKTVTAYKTSKFKKYWQQEEKNES